MSLIKVALSHYCCRTTLQWQCHEIVLKLSVDRVRQLKQYSLEFAAEGEQGRHVPDMTRQRIPGSCCSRRKLRICFLRLSCCGFFCLIGGQMRLFSVYYAVSFRDALQLSPLVPVDTIYHHPHVR